MAYQPGAGLKRPLNMLETPVYPDIKQAPPRFRDAGKFWNVDVGRTMIETSMIPQFIESAVLVQSRDYNSQHAYGKSSFRDAVNLEFRPPLITMEDNMPLSRLPRPIVVPRINPGTAQSTGTSGYAEQNNYPSQVGSFITDRIKSGDWRPTFFAPLEVPTSNDVLPDLEMKMPAYSSSAGFNFPSINSFVENQPPVTIDYQKLDANGDAGFTSPITLDAPARQDIELDYNRPQTSVTAGLMLNQYQPGVTPVDMNLDYNRPQASATAGFSMNQYQPGVTPIDMNLNYNRPQVSVSAGVVAPVAFGSDQTRTDILLNEKLRAEIDTTPTYDYQSTNYQTPVEDNVVRDGNPRVSYEGYQNIPFRSTNERTTNVMVQQKKHALASYKPYNNKTFIPRSGLDLQPVTLRRGTPSRTPQYRF